MPLPVDSYVRWMRLAGVLLAAGALMMVAKGVLLIATGNDRSLVPWFGLFANTGLALAGLALVRSVSRLRWLAMVGGAGALVGLSASVVAVVYLVSGTIPESEGAPSTVGASYAVLALGVVLSLLCLGFVISHERLLPGRWRWFPLGVLVAQFPIFIVAGAIGDGIGSEKVADGLGLALTGAMWVLLGFAVTRIQQTAPAAL